MSEQGSGFGPVFRREYPQGSGETMPAALVVRVPRGIRSKEKLFAILADKLHFPAYFGWNWDALEECLRDLAWLPAHQPVVVLHEEWPFGAGGENRGVYQSVLEHAVDHWATTGERDVKVVPPNQTLDDL